MYTCLSKTAKQLKTTIKTIKSYIKDSTLFRRKFEIKAVKYKSIALGVQVSNLETNQISRYD